MKLHVEAWELIAGEQTPDRTLDLRPRDLWTRGHLPGAESLPYTHFQDEAPQRLSQSESILLVDGAGARAAEMVVWLRERGFQASYLKGGMARWVGELERPEDEGRRGP